MQILPCYYEYRIVKKTTCNETVRKRKYKRRLADDFCERDEKLFTN